MIKRGWLIVFVCLFTLQLTAQTIENIKINTQKTPLSEVLLDLKDRYGLQFAFDNDLLSNYNISVKRTFKTETEALLFLIKKLPLEVERSGDVFLIIPKTETEKELAGPIQISGQVLEANTHEPLPFSYILINRKSVMADQQGNFNFLASADTSVNVRISHLGYFMYDTVVTQTLHKQFFLMPQLEQIREVKVVSNAIEKSTLIGNTSGRMKINHQIAPVLPGFGDNSVFNLLRLMPGILAAGEQSGGLFIWGAYESHSKIQFDGFTIFGSQNFNENIGVVNPLVVKNIEVMKGGYEARYGERVGGIVDIVGKDGTLQKPTFTFSINSTTLNTMLQLPLTKKSSLLAAYRQTYYKLYDPTSFTLLGKKNTAISNGDYDISSDFDFRDANLKYTYKGDDGSRFALSLYGGGDAFGYTAEKDGVSNKTKSIRSEEEKNRQSGASAQYSLPWRNESTTNFTLAYSDFGRKSFEQNANEKIRQGNKIILKETNSENKVREINFTAEHTLNFNEGHKLIIGAGAISNQVSFLRLSNNGVEMDLDNKSTRLFSYVQDELPLGKNFDLNAGLRMTFERELQQAFFEPRVSASVKMADGVKLNASWGLYNQFLSKAMLVDSASNFAYFWLNADNENIPVLHARHLVAGLSFSRNGFTFHAEGFYRTTHGLTRYLRENKYFDEGFYEGDAKTHGLDIFIKKEYRQHMAWVSYTLSKTEEHYAFYKRAPYYRPAPHNQTHELKFAGIVNIKSFYLSCNYVYGSGFNRYSIEPNEGINPSQVYSRLDAAAIYKFKPGKVKAETGISLLNVLDTDNAKYLNRSEATIDDIKIDGRYPEGIPFTPTLFFKLEF